LRALIGVPDFGLSEVERRLQNYQKMIPGRTEKHEISQLQATELIGRAMEVFAEPSNGPM
jgi:hypothetical protein